MTVRILQGALRSTRTSAMIAVTYVAGLKAAGIELPEAIWEDKPRDFRFPWDIVKVRATREELWKHHERMRRKAAAV